MSRPAGRPRGPRTADAMSPWDGSSSLDDAPVPEITLLALTVAQLRQDGGRVLAEERRRAIHGAGRVRELHRHAERLDGPRPGVHEIHDHVPRQRLRVGKRLGVVVDGARGHAFLVQTLEPDGPRLAYGGLLDLRDQRGPVLEALPAAREARVGGELRAPDGAAEALEQLVVVGSHREVAVGGAKRLVRRREAVSR